MMQKKHSKVISVLICPDDNAEPYSFQIKTNVVKALYAVGALLILHIIAGGIFYWKYAKLSNRHEVVLVENSQLRDDNKRVIAIEDAFYTLEKNYAKVRSLLEVENPNKYAANGHAAQKPKAKLIENIVPAVKTIMEFGLSLSGSRGAYFLTPKKSKMHNYAENMPTLLPVKGFMTEDFQKSDWFLPKNHDGVDIVAKMGSVIRATGGGTIIFAQWTYDFGNLIIIDHGGGIHSYYGHNQRLLKHEGSYVRKGEAIALLGTSGKSTGPHLHFEIRKEGVPVDPKGYILAFNQNIMTN